MFARVCELDRQLRRWNEQRKRGPRIASALPEMIDLLALTLKAGLDFQVALKHYVDKGPEGPLRDEFTLVYKEIQFGTSRIEALRHLCARASDLDLKETARTFIRGIELGASLTPMLRAQSQALRRKRVYQAERKAAVAPLKLLFPLMVFIFPTIFIVLFGPLALEVFK